MSGDGAEWGALLDEVADLRQQVSAQQELNRKSLADLDAKDETVRGLRAENTDLRDELAQANLDNAGLGQERDALTSELERVRADCTRLHGSIDFFAQRFLALAAGQHPTAESGTSG